MRWNKILLVTVILIAISLFYGRLILEVTKLEKENNKLEIEIINLTKDKKRKISDYDDIMDLKKIENEMRVKNKMEVANKINFFRIKNKSF